MFELSPANAAEYLRSKGWLPPGPARVEALGWGVSNAVLRIESAEGRFVVKQSRPQLRTKDAWFSDIDRVYREARVMQLLAPLLPPATVPEVLFVDRENYLFGMSHAPPDAAVWKETLLAGRTDPAVAHFAGRVLGLIHEETARRRDLIGDLRDPTVFVQLRVDPFYQRIRERRPEVAAAVTPLIDQMMNLTEALCHGDFSPKNMLVHPEADGRFTLVDYETAYLGDPTMDLGFFLSHLMLKAIKHHTNRTAFYGLTEAFWESYSDVVRFRPIEELMARGIQHFGVCALARIDGTSPVDYLPEEPKREAVRRLCRRVLGDRPRRWAEVEELSDIELRAAGLI